MSNEEEDTLPCEEEDKGAATSPTPVPVPHTPTHTHAHTQAHTYLRLLQHLTPVRISLGFKL